MLPRLAENSCLATVLGHECVTLLEMCLPGRMIPLQLELLAMLGPNPVPCTPARCLGRTLAVGSSARALFDPRTDVFLDPKPSVQSEE